MKFTTNVRVLGIKSSKGIMDNGQSFDSTKVYIEQALDDSKGNAKGFAVQEYNFGLSDTFAQFKHLNFPFDGVADIEITTNGKTQKAVIVALKPVPSAASGKAA